MDHLVPKPSVPHLHDLTVDKVDEVVLDLRLVADGATIHFAVDPYEIAEFCFPVNPSNTKPVDIDVIADNQASFNEIFFRRQHRPLLLPEYFKELRGILNYFDHQLSDAYSKAEILQELIRAGQLGEIVGKRKQAYEDIAEDHFNVLLAVARGVYSVGVERFRVVYNQRLLKENQLDTEDADDKLVINEILTSYSESPLKRKIYTEIGELIKNSNETAVEKERRRRSLLVDAGAIDRTIYLNMHLEKAFKQKRLKRRCVILYFSSAVRTRRIFNLAQVRAALPEINGSKYPIWRTRNQVFAYVVYKSSNPDSGQQILETIHSLEKIKSVLLELDKLQNFQCDSCLLKGQTPGDCALIQFCSDITSLVGEIKIARNQIENLGLINNLGEDYKRLIDVQTSPVGLRFQSYLDLFADVCSSGIKDIALDRMNQKQHWIIINSEAANLFKEGFMLGRDKRPLSFRTSRDEIINIDQILPFKPQMKSRRYTQILESILTYCRDPTPGQFKLLEGAHKQYVRLDPGPGKRDPEQELLNCYLYLAFGRGSDETKAYKYAKELVQSSSTTGAGRNMEREYRYVLLWAARRQGQFKEADDCANKAIVKWRSDPRFYHGRCLNTYAWLQKEGEHCPLTIRDAIADAQKAIELYKRAARKNRDVLAANYNNLAYFFAMDAIAPETYNEDGLTKLGEARNVLSSLKKLAPKSNWLPEHPEYHHTEAFLEYQEFLMGFARNTDVEQLRDKLRHAQVEIDKAIKAFSNNQYLQLKKLIDNALDRIA